MRYCKREWYLPLPFPSPMGEHPEHHSDRGALCSAVFGRDMPIHLCTYHVVTAWYKAICQHVTRGHRDLKATIRRIFKDIHAVMYHPGTDSLEESRAAVQAAMTQFKKAWEHEERVVEYFEFTWERKIGASTPCLGLA